MNNYSLDDFLRDVLGMTPPWTLRDLGQPLPTQGAVNECCYQIERQLQAEAAEAETEERKRLEAE